MLTPCPACGGKPDHVEGVHGYVVYCSSCNMCLDQDGGQPTLEGAEAAWEYQVEVYLNWRAKHPVKAEPPEADVVVLQDWVDLHLQPTKRIVLRDKADAVVKPILEELDAHGLLDILEGFCLSYKRASEAFEIVAVFETGKLAELGWAIDNADLVYVGKKESP